MALKDQRDILVCVQHLPDCTNIHDFSYA